jgi:NAD(P)H-hydrate epimerase
MDVLTGEQIKELDRLAVNAGIPDEILMETAGRAVAEAILSRLSVNRIVAIAGTGGNGGDALVAARRLYEKGLSVKVFIASNLEKLSPATREKAKLFAALAPDAVRTLSDGVAGFSESLTWADCVIDGLLGIGVDRPLSGDYAQLVEQINLTQVKRVAIDLPSGLPADVGEPLGGAVHADLTVCMEAYKPAHLLYPSRDYCGQIELVHVGYPAQVLAKIRPIARLLDEEWLRARLPDRRPDGHKGTFGKVLLVAGSRGMSGAAILACRGALRVGAGLVTLACPASLNTVFETALVESLTSPFTDADGRLGKGSLKEILPLLARADICAIGPGIGRYHTTGEAVRGILQELDIPVVIDADALFHLAGDLGLLAPLAGRVVLTPHPGELARLIERPIEEINSSRIEVAREFAEKWGVVLLLKGRPTVIGTPQGEVWINPTGNSGLATGGSGDVLTGMIAGLMGQGLNPEVAAAIGAYLHGLTADILAREMPECSIIPTDLPGAIPAAIAQVKGCCKNLLPQSPRSTQRIL